MNVTDQAVALIAKHGSMYSPEIGAALGISSVDVWLRDKVADGTLIACDVQRAGEPACKQYRMSVRAGGAIVEVIGSGPGRPVKKADPVAERLKEFKGFAASPAEQAAPLQPKPPVVPRQRITRRDASQHRVTPPPAPRPEDGVQRIGPIETNVPVPTTVGNLRGALRVMRAGQSRLITGYSKHNIENAAWREGMSAIVRAEGEGFRIWCVDKEAAAS